MLFLFKTVQVSKARTTLVFVFYTWTFSLKNKQSGNALIKCHPPSSATLLDQTLNKYSTFK